MTLGNLGSVAVKQGHDAKAAELLGEGLLLRREMGDKRGTASILDMMGLLLLAMPIM